MNPGNLISAVRGPIMLITLGSLFALDHLGMLSFGRTWPLLIIMFGVLKLAERAGGANEPYPPYQGGAPTPGGPQQ